MALSDIFERKFGFTQYDSDLRQSIDWHEQALEKGISDVRRWALLVRLGTNYIVLFDRTQSDEDLKRSDKTLKQSFHLTISPRLRLLVGSNIVGLAALRGLWSRTAAYLNKIMPLLPGIIPPSRSREDSISILRKLHGIAPISATVYLNDGRSPIKAPGALESFRRIIANLQIDTKSDDNMLKEEHTRPYTKYSGCRDSIMHGETS